MRLLSRIQFTRFLISPLLKLKDCSLRGEGANFLTNTVYNLNLTVTIAPQIEMVESSKQPVMLPLYGWIAY